MVEPLEHFVDSNLSYDSSSIAESENLSEVSSTTSSTQGSENGGSDSDAPTITKSNIPVPKKHSIESRANEALKRAIGNKKMMIKSGVPGGAGSRENVTPTSDDGRYEPRYKESVESIRGKKNHNVIIIPRYDPGSAGGQRKKGDVSNDDIIIPRYEPTRSKDDKDGGKSRGVKFTDSPVESQHDVSDKEAGIEANGNKKNNGSSGDMTSKGTQLPKKLKNTTQSPTQSPPSSRDEVKVKYLLKMKKNSQELKQKRLREKEGNTNSPPIPPKRGIKKKNIKNSDDSMGEDSEKSDVTDSTSNESDIQESCSESSSETSLEGDYSIDDTAVESTCESKGQSEDEDMQQNEEKMKHLEEKLRQIKEKMKQKQLNEQKVEKKEKNGVKVPKIENEMPHKVEIMVQNTENLPRNKEKLPQIEKNVSQNEENVDRNENDEQVEEKVQHNENSVPENEENTEQNEEELPKNEEKIIQIENDLPVNEEQMEATVKDLAENDVSIQENEERIEINENKLPHNDEIEQENEEMIEADWIEVNEITEYETNMPQNDETLSGKVTILETELQTIDKELSSKNNFISNMNEEILRFRTVMRDAENVISDDDNNGNNDNTNTINDNEHSECSMNMKKKCRGGECVLTDDGDDMLLCDECNMSFHYACTLLPSYQLAHCLEQGYVCVNCVVVPDHLKDFLIEKESGMGMNSQRSEKDTRKIYTVDRDISNEDLLESIRSIFEDQMSAIFYTLENLIDNKLAELTNFDEPRMRTGSEIVGLNEGVVDVSGELKKVIREAKTEEKAEESDIEKRLNNFLIHGSEEVGETNEEAKDEDSRYVTNVLIKLGVDSEPKMITRIGEPNERKMRPIKVIMKTNAEKKLVMSRLKRLKGTAKEFGRISITDDYTPAEREEIKLWFQKAKYSSARDPDRQYKVRGDPRNGLRLMWSCKK